MNPFHLELTLMIRMLIGHHRISGEAVDTERDLHLVPEHLLLLPPQRRHMEGKT